MDDSKEFADAIKERFKILPKVVQSAITSADIEKHLRELADTHKLHLDQWQLLENQVMLALLGIHETKDLEKNIENEVGVAHDIAVALTVDISRIVFEPIREELERQLEHPSAQPAPATTVPAPALKPATPPTEPPKEKAVRAIISEAYRAGEPSTMRKAVSDDPYRESVV
jgi:hypothetical protein